MTDTRKQVGSTPGERNLVDEVARLADAVEALVEIGQAHLENDAAARELLAGNPVHNGQAGEVLAKLNAEIAALSPSNLGSSVEVDPKTGELRTYKP